MRNAFRTVIFLSLVGGWALSAASLHLLRTPGRLTLFPKDHLGFHDTYVDARTWTLADAAAHPALVTHLLRLGHADLLAHTTNPSLGDPAAQLANAANHPLPEVTRPNPHPLFQTIATRLHTTTDAVRAFFD